VILKVNIGLCVQMTTLPAEQLFNMTRDVLLAHVDRVNLLQELGVRTAFHYRYNYLCIFKSPTSVGFKFTTPTAKNIVDNALTIYKRNLGLERERIAQRSREEQARAAAVADHEATVRFKANR
jgi:hypothetical protein